MLWWRWTTLILVKETREIKLGLLYAINSCLLFFRHCHNNWWIEEWRNMFYIHQLVFLKKEKKKTTKLPTLEIILLFVWLPSNLTLVCGIFLWNFPRYYLQYHILLSWPDVLIHFQMFSSVVDELSTSTSIILSFSPLIFCEIYCSHASVKSNLLFIDRSVNWSS